MFQVAVKVTLKKEILDVQGRAVLETLNRKGFSVQDCRYGKFIVLSIDALDKDQALAQAKDMAESILCNRLVEDYELALIEGLNGKTDYKKETRF